LSTADRARALSVFQARSPSKTLAARIIGNGTGANSKAVFVDRGSGSGVEAGMAVVTPDGIVGKVVAAYPTASLVLLITDANFAAGVISQKNRVHGTLKGQGHDGSVLVDYIQNEEKIDSGEWFYTSGDDRIFPKGFPVGQVTAVRNGRTVKEVYVTPSGFQNGLEEVLVVLDAVHQEIPDVQMASAAYRLLQAPPQASDPAVPGFPQQSTVATEADKLKEQYRQVGVAEKHIFGEGVPGSPPPDFTKMGPPRVADAAANPASPKPGTTTAPGTTTTPGTTPAPNREREQAAAPATGKAPVSGAKPALTAGAPANGGSAQPTTIPAKPKSRSSGPLLVTDPTDADPSEPAPPPASSRPEKTSRPREADLNEFGEPKPPQKAPARRATSVDGSTEILPPAPPPRVKPKPTADKTTNLQPTNLKPVAPKQPSGAAAPPPSQ
jgi:rod shape-determining protein MreC